MAVVCFCHHQAIAQCDNTLVDKAAAQSGNNAVYLREFKLRFDEPEQGRIIPTGRYPVFLSRNTNYRFNVCNAEEFDGKVILQLYFKGQLMGSTYDVINFVDLQRFDFKCDKTGTYEVIMSFDKGKAGCAVGILSQVSENESGLASEELDILYTNVDNPVSIYNEEDEYAKIDVSIDNGTISKVDRINYVVRPQRSGTALLTIRVLNPNGTLKEFKQKDFAVLAFDKPFAAIAKNRGGDIRKQELLKSARLELWFSENIKCNYKITSFTLSDRNDLISGISSTSAKLTKPQLDWLEKQTSGTRLYFKNIQAKTTDNVLIEIPSITFELE